MTGEWVVKARNQYGMHVDQCKSMFLYKGCGYWISALVLFLLDQSCHLL